MNRVLIRWIFGCCLLILFAEADPAVALADTHSSFLKLSVSPARVKQGQSFTVFLTSSGRLKSMTIAGMGRQLYLYKIWHKDHEHLFRGFVGVPPYLEPGSYKIIAEAVDEQDESLRIYTTVKIAPARYKVQKVALTRKKMSLINVRNLRSEGSILGQKLRIRHRKVYFASHFIRPAKGRISSPFGVRRRYNGGEVSSYHKGIDIANAKGTPVVASNGGQVSLAVNMKSNGKIVLINHGHGVTTIYSHLSKIRVTEGQWVKQGDLIGNIGSTGISSGPHLHFGFSVNNVRVDPMQWLQSQPTIYYNSSDYQ